MKSYIEHIYLQFTPYDAEIIPIVQDSCGMVVEEIEKVLAERKKKLLPIPKVSYYYVQVFVYIFVFPKGLSKYSCNVVRCNNTKLKERNLDRY